MSESSDRTTLEESRNVELVKEYMLIAYDPRRAGAEAVSYLCAPNNTFVAPTTFPNVHTLEQYAEEHGKLMKQVNDLHLISFDVLFARGHWVCLRYTAEGKQGDGADAKAAGYRDKRVREFVEEKSCEKKKRGDEGRSPDPGSAPPG